MLLEGLAKFPFDGSAGGAVSFVVEEWDSMFALSAGEVELVTDAEYAHDAKLAGLHVADRGVDHDVRRDAGVMDAGSTRLLRLDKDY